MDAAAMEISRAAEHTSLHIRGETSTPNTCSFALSTLYDGYACEFVQLQVASKKEQLPKDCKRDRRRKKTHREDLVRCGTVPETAVMPLPDSFNMPRAKYVKSLMNYCLYQGWSGIWIFSDSFILITGAAANAALLWLLLRGRKSLSASQVLGLNLVAMDFIFLSIMPVGLVHDTILSQAFHKNVSDFSDIMRDNLHTWKKVGMTRNAFSIFNLIGCPLLLACMCMERYLAVMRPVLYLRARKLEYRMAVSAVVWVFTLSFCVAAALVDDVTVVMLAVSVTVSCLFILMLASLGGVVWSLRQPSPAHTAPGNQARSDSPLRRRAIVNVLVVVVPAVFSYLPVLILFPVVLYIYYTHKPLGMSMCNVFELSTLFPRFGVFIGPLFYLSKAKQIWCFGGTGKTFNE